MKKKSLNSKLTLSSRLNISKYSLKLFSKINFNPQHNFRLKINSTPLSINTPLNINTSLSSSTHRKTKISNTLLIRVSSFKVNPRSINKKKNIKIFKRI